MPLPTLLIPNQNCTSTRNLQSLPYLIDLLTFCKGKNAKGARTSPEEIKQTADCTKYIVQLGDPSCILAVGDSLLDPTLKKPAAFDARSSAYTPRAPTPAAASHRGRRPAPAPQKPMQQHDPKDYDDSLASSVLY